MAVLEGGQTWGLSSATSLSTSSSISTSAPLTSGYGSSTSGPTSAGGRRRKTAICVKLTDSSLRALESYLNNKSVFPTNETNEKPTIQFPTEGQDFGAFSIPMGNGKKAEFSFSLSSTDDANGPQGSFECLASSDRKNRTLESLGSISQKIQVHASDDAYKRFGQKMHEAKKESDKRSTRILENRPGGSSRLGGGAKVVRKPFSHAHRSSMGVSSSSSSSSSSLPANPLKGLVSAPSNPRLPENHPMLERKHRPNNSYQYTHANKGHLGSMGVAGMGGGGVANPEIMRRPLKERIIHLLAVRPYKKPELMSRIQREGIREKDRKNITLVLKQVSSMKDNCYNLLRHIWNDVSEDWPYYSEQERQSFRRRKPQNLTPPCSDGSTSSSGHSPHSSSHTNGPSSSSTVVGRGVGGAMVGGNKRRSPSSLYDVASGPGLPDPKKKRMSNYVRPSDSKYMSGHESSSPARHTPTSAHAGLGLGKSPRFGASPGGGQGHHKAGQHGGHHHHHHQKAKQHFAAPPGGHHSSGVANYDSAGSGADDIEPNFSGMGGVTGGPSWEEYTPNSSPDSREGDSQEVQADQPGQAEPTSTPYQEQASRSSSSREEESSNSSSKQQQQQQQASGSELAGITQPHTGSLSKDYLTEYTTITSYEQRKRYKETFAGEYAMYRKLYTDHTKVTEKFTALEARLNQEIKGSETWQRLQSKIVREYQANIAETRAKKARLRYLHLKLAHIKKLVSDFDHAHLGGGGAAATPSAAATGSPRPVAGRVN